MCKVCNLKKYFQIIHTKFQKPQNFFTSKKRENRVYFLNFFLYAQLELLPQTAIATIK